MRIKLQVDLLEAIRQAELPFIFKGGTSLLLLPETPRRLSTDIDINQPGRNGAYLWFLSAQTSRSLRKKYLTVWR
ncbi:MAG: nucleotidyl transferase AbiEii/AbiGii toxin family protein [Lachnospiraceae bacterium]|nr:nucleotidyl transferase AbiEii/AbiGii toxin family protein [Lachnospiraceae bacterium]MBF0999329.1 nucleotidyl transferase AbiEii/AbiGii toxin family protein [Lachnospiraceae bacterium]MBF1013304.1 nucleotidyl transferase AbiEii/AbiGii toxin family protein [Lachnospiraceae bacterium]MBF1029984.1 nucleotidyl transferase AbiEii/AbiGii toxin family protein [Lachnospiraceae bacterium]